MSPSSHTSSLLEKGSALYNALGTGDVATLEQLLSEDFQGRLTEGLPQGFGRSVYSGRDAMLNDGWGSIGAFFDMRPEVERMIDGGDTLVGMGSYVGTAKPTGKDVRAAFAHFWTYDGEHFTGVRQVTDSALWERALNG